MNLNYPEIKNWMIFYIGSEKQLHGYIYGDDFYPQGARITTSIITRMFLEQDYLIIETEDGRYKVRKEEIDPVLFCFYEDIWGKILEEIGEVQT